MYVGYESFEGRDKTTRAGEHPICVVLSFPLLDECKSVKKYKTPEFSATVFPTNQPVLGLFFAELEDDSGNCSFSL